MKLLLSVLLFLSGLASPLHAQQSTATSTTPAPLPGVAELIPRLSRLTDYKSTTSTQIAALKETSSIEEQLLAAQKNQEELNRRIAELGDPVGWNFDRLLEIKGRLTEQRDTLHKVIEALSSRLENLDTIRREWLEKQQFWQGWENALQAPELEFPEDAFPVARGAIELILKDTTLATGPLVGLQKESIALLEKNQEQLRRIDQALTLLRSQTFKETGRPFFSESYYRQFRPELWQAVKRGISAVELIPWDFFRHRGWAVALQLLVTYVLSAFIRRHREKAQETEEWLFILHHPWATGIFVSVLALSFLYASPPPLWRLVLWTLATFSASILLAGMLKNPRKIFTVHLLATLLVLSLALQVISFPAPLYRLYLALLSLAGAPILWLMASSNIKAHQGKVDSFSWALRGGAAVLGIAFLAQVFGYSSLSSRLIESSVATVLIIILATMAVRLGQGGLDYLLCHELPERSKFFRGFGEGLAERLKRILLVLVSAYTLLYLLVTWGLYDTVGQGWDHLLGRGITFGETFVSLQMVLSAGLILYLSILSSWILRAVLSAKVFPRSRLDRGMRDSIKKLLHYSLVLVGFLVAMSLAGVELKHFIVLAGAFGIGIGFGLQNVVNNFVSGLILLFERPIKVGDTVVMDNQWGTIKKIGLRSTIVETWERAEIIVPNSQLISEKVTNWTLSTNVARETVSVGVAYGSDIPLVLSILQEAAKEHPDVLNDPPPSPIFVGFGESSLDFELRVWMVDVVKRLKIKSDLGQYIERRFRQEGVQIPFPQRDLHLRSIDEDLCKKSMEGEKEG